MAVHYERLLGKGLNDLVMGLLEVFYCFCASYHTFMICP